MTYQPADEQVTAIMTRAAEEEIPTVIRPVSLTPALAVSGEGPALWAMRLRPLAAEAASTLVAAGQSCVVAARALEQFAQREFAQWEFAPWVLALITAALLITFAATGGMFAAALVQRLQG